MRFSFLAAFLLSAVDSGPSALFRLMDVAVLSNSGSMSGTPPSESESDMVRAVFDVDAARYGLGVTEKVPDVDVIDKTRLG